jgi:excisionase family DNA binding protein
MRTREPVPDRSYGDDYPEQVPLGQLPGSERGLGSRPSLTIAEAARLCGVSVSTIRRYLAAGRFPTPHQQPSPIPGQRGLWRIPTQELLPACDHARPAYPTKHRRPSLRVAQPPARLVLTGFENSSTPRPNAAATSTMLRRSRAQ